jgi:hypothetical protein
MRKARTFPTKPAGTYAPVTGTRTFPTKPAETYASSRRTPYVCHQTGRNVPSLHHEPGLTVVTPLRAA